LPKLYRCQIDLTTVGVALTTPRCAPLVVPRDWLGRSAGPARPCPRSWLLLRRPAIGSGTSCTARCRPMGSLLYLSLAGAEINFLELS
jgi:hypothetical protein